MLKTFMIVSDNCRRSYKDVVIPFNDWFKTIFICLITLLLTACEKDFEIDIKDYQPQVVVEGYINNEMPQFNYVILSRSMDYYNPDFQSAAVSGATVTITEGSLAVNNSYNWDPATKVQLFEANLPQVPENFRQGVYFD